MPKDSGLEQAFNDILEGKASRDASSQLEPLAKLASALRSEATGPTPQFRARLRSQLLAQASEEPQDVFAAALDGMLLEMPADIKPLVMVAAALESDALPVPSPSFRFQLRNQLVAEASTQTGRGKVADRLAAINGRMRRSFRTVFASGLAAAVLAGSSVAMAASSGALPGDPLYGLKRFREGTQLMATSGVDEGNRLLSYARTRLGEISGLTERGSKEQALYVSTLNDMDDETVRGAQILIDEFRAHGSRDALQHVTSFARVQTQDLSRLIDLMPPGARPTAHDSLSLVERVGTRAADALSGCPCPSNALQDLPGANRDTTGSNTGSSSVPTCACERGTGRGTLGSRGDGSSGGDTNNGSGGGDNGTGTGGGDNGSGGGNGGGSDGGDGGTDVVSPPDVPGTGADNDVEDTLNDLIDSVTSPLPSLPPVPTPTPSTPGLPLP